MNLRKFWGVLLLGAVTVLPAQAGSGSTVDPAARFGQLDNGVRYVIYPNSEPQERASLRLLVQAGSFQEREDQRGVAHFLEHMAFNGSEHYAPGTLIEFFQRMGMSFGGDTNAFTSFERTQYMIELPKTDEETLAEGLQVLGDYAGGLLLLSEEIDRERGIILNEKRARDNVGFRTLVARLEFMLGDTLLPHRLPIGLEEVIRDAPRERFVEFWNEWYRPDNIVVIAVGDFETDRVEELIRKQFSGLQPRAEVPADPDLGTLPEFEGLRTWFHAEPEAPMTMVSITQITPAPNEPDSAAKRIESLPRSLALEILNRRFSELAKKEGAPFTQAYAAVYDQYRLYRQTEVTVTCTADQWAAALAVGEQELRRALEHGFHEAELREVVAGYTNGLEQAVKRASTRRSGGLANQIANSIVRQEAFTHPEADRDLLVPALEKITPEECLSALRAAFDAPGRFVMVTGNVEMPGEAAAAIETVYHTSATVAVHALLTPAEAEWGYAAAGEPGKVIKREHVEDLDVELVTFANGVKLNLKRTDFEAGRISTGVRVGSGSITQPKGKAGLGWLASGTFYAGGLGKHSADELRRVLAGRNVASGFGMDTDAFVFNGGTTPEDLPLQLELIVAQLTDAGWRPEALRQARKGIEQMYLGFEFTSNGAMAREVAPLLANGDERFGMPAKEVMLERTLDEVEAWLAPELAHGALEVSLVGDLDIEAAIKAAAATIGALPPRAERKDLADLKQVSFPDEPFVRHYEFVSEIPKGNVIAYWPTTDGMDIQTNRRLSLLGRVLSDRLRVKIREEIAGSYSPGAGSFASDTFPDYGYLQARCIVSPEDAEKILAVMVEIGDDLAKNGVSVDELNRAREPMLTSARESLRTNGYWGGSVLARAQEKPEVLNWARSRIPDLESVTADELTALAKAFLGADRVSTVTIVPKAK